MPNLFEYLANIRTARISLTIAIRVVAAALLIAGCGGLMTDRDIARERAQAYLAAHPNLAPNTAEAIRANLILDGMMMEQVTAAWGPPAVVQGFSDGAVQYWFFGCDWPHFCVDVDRLNDDAYRYQSRALFENGLVVDWQI